MIVAQISDTHLCLDCEDAGRRATDFSDTVADINALDPLPDLVVHTGDVVHNGREDEYRAAAEILARARPPVFAIPGNKDRRAAMRAELSRFARFEAGKPFLDYAVDDFPIPLIALDTLDEAGNKGDFCDARRRRLAAMIAARPAGPVIAFAHHPPFEVLVGPDRWHFAEQAAADRLTGELLRSGRVAGLFCGHVHRPFEARIGDIQGMVMPCVATTLRRGEYPARVATRPIYYIHRFDASGAFSTEARVVPQT
jgi:3',5'-cyclic AMP phosphodiesterase CpdA